MHAFFITNKGKREEGKEGRREGGKKGRREEGKERRDTFFPIKNTYAFDEFVAVRFCRKLLFS